MKRTKKSYSVEEMVQIVTWKQKGKPNSYIASKLNRSSEAIATAYSKWKLYTKDGRRDGKIIEQAKLFDEVNQALAGNFDSAPHKDRAVENPFDRVNQTLEAFLSAVVDVAQSQVGDKTQQALDEQKAQYEKKLEYYQKLLDVAQQSNMVGFIKKKLGIAE